MAEWEKKRLKNVRERNNKNKLESIEEQAEKKFKHQNTDKNLFRSYPTVVNTKHSVDTDKFQTQKTKTNVKSVGCSAFLYKETQRQRWKRWNAKSKKIQIHNIYQVTMCIVQLKLSCIGAHIWQQSSQWFSVNTQQAYVRITSNKTMLSYLLHNFYGYFIFLRFFALDSLTTRPICTPIFLLHLQHSKWCFLKTRNICSFASNRFPKKIRKTIALRNETHLG